MKKTFLIALVASVVLVSCKTVPTRSYNKGINIIPMPKEMTINDTVNVFTLKKGISIGITTDELKVPADYLAAKLSASTGFSVGIADKGAISLAINPDLPLGDEGYTLVSTAEGVRIEAKTPHGAFYGVQTLLQMLPAEVESTTVVKDVDWNVPLVTINDEPRFGYRGQMFDVCRHFESVEDVKRQLDVLAMYKINRMHFHLTEDQGWRIEIKQYPKLATVGATRIEGDGSTYGPFAFTQEQIKDIVAYAAARYIDVIPEIELPGHGMAALSGYPEFSCTGGPFTPRIIWGVEDEVYCVGNDATFTFLENIITEVAALFPSKYFHIGGDECPKARWKECPKCQARARELNLRPMTDANGVKHSVEEQLQSYAVKRIEKHVSSLGKRMIGWDEILEGGLAPGAIVMSWRGEEGGVAAAKEDHEVIMTPNPKGLYIDHFQGAPEVEPMSIGGYSTLETVYNFDPIPEKLPADKHHLVIGAQTNLWTEYVLDAKHVDYMMFPRSIALAEMTWTALDKKDYKDFERRINNAMARMDYHDVNYHIPIPEGALTRNVVFTGDSTLLEFTNTRNYPMVYTLDGSEPTAKSAVYEKPIVVSKDTEVKIASITQTSKLSTVRTIPVTKVALSPAVTPTTAPEIAKLAPAEGSKAGQGAVMRVADGLYLDEASAATAKYGEPIIIGGFKGLTSKFDMKKPSLAIIEGYVTLHEDGVYILTSDVQELWIDGERVIFNLKMARHNTFKVQKALAKGTHSYKMLFNNRIIDGWPTTWTEIAFRYKAPSDTKFTQVKPEELSY